MGIWRQLTGPGLPRPYGRRRTFIEWVLDATMRLAMLTISLCAIGIALLVGFFVLGILAALF